MTAEEKLVVKGFAGPVWSFMMGDVDNGAGLEDAKMVKRLRADGEVDRWEDEEWERGVKVWEIVREAQNQEGRKGMEAKL